MNKHVHAELMAEYAKDALETNKPWERWEVQFPSGSEWFDLTHHPLWQPDMEYRKKEKAYRIGAIFNEQYLLAQVDTGVIKLIHLQTGNRVSDCSLKRAQVVKFFDGPYVNEVDIIDALQEPIDTVDYT